jgi:hypothetical protein
MDKVKMQGSDWIKTEDIQEFLDLEGYVVVKKEEGAFCHNGFYYPEKGKGDARAVKCGNWKEDKYETRRLSNRENMPNR